VPTRKIAHDLNNLLQTIAGNAELLKEDLPPTGALFEWASTIVEAARQAAELTQDLLAGAREIEGVSQVSDR
jgi:signal transduction histidine kinase